MSVGDIVAHRPKIDVEFRVIAKRYYKSFREMLVSEGIKKVLPDMDSVEEGEKVYYRFFSKEDEKKYGVVAIEVEVVG